jgi:hypothetical protein
MRRSTGAEEKRDRSRDIGGSAGNIRPRLYAKLNYRYLETLAGYYRGREDAYRMMRIIE